MEILDIIKESFVFPTKDIGKLAIYIVFSVVIAGLLVGGALTTILSLDSISVASIVSVILFICALILGFILSGYHVSLIRSGINQDDDLPDFHWKEDLLVGIKNFVVTIIYYIIPSIIVFVVALITNVPGNINAIFQNAFENSINSTVSANITVPAVDTLSNTLLNNLISSLAITAVVAIVVFIIFAFIQTMAVSRLAKTDSLGESLNIIEAFKDIGRIGYGKVIAVILLIVIITIIINAILSLIGNYVPQITILSIIITPYLMFFSARAIGLLYSDIA